jgi:Ca-activated chloride channel family protein
MNRTALFLTSAGALAVLALVAAPRPAPPLPARVVTAGPSAGPSGPRLPANAQHSGEGGGLQLTGKLASGYVANGGAFNYLTLEVAAPHDEEKAPRTPANLVVVIDRSGSMRGQKMHDAVAAARALVDALSPDDRLAVVDYATDVRSFPSTRADARGKAALSGYIAGLRDEGSTNISGGLEHAAQVGRVHQREYRTNRIILLSDGQPTTGITSAQGLSQLVSRIREEGFTVTSLGVGADFDERLMRELATAGGGFYGYVDDSSRLAGIFAQELDQASRMVARDLELHLETPPGVVVEEVLGRSFVRNGRGATVRLYDLSAGLSNRMVVRFKVDAPANAPMPAPLKAKLSWFDLRAGIRKTAEVSLTGTVTSDPQRALDHADPDVLSHAAQAEAARQMQAAAQLARQGRREEADRHLSFSLGNIRQMFGSSASALAGSTLEESRANLRTGDLNRAAKELDRKTSTSFGEHNAY